MKASYYDDNAEEFIANTLHVDMTSLYQEFVRYLPKHGKVLDAGCGSGRDSLAFMKMGFDVDAFDASQAMVRHARELTGIPVQHRSFDQFEATHLYDGIWCCASLLHVRTADLLQAMQPLAKALKENGVWYVSFKYGHEEREKDGRHFTDFKENLLSELVSKLNRITILSTWVTTDKRPDRNEPWLNALLTHPSESVILND